MWLQLLVTLLIGVIMLLIWQRWKVSSEWLKMEQELTEEEYTKWKKEKFQDAEDWAERWKGVESAFLIFLSVVMLGFWYFI
tara:strand:+ start:673 stop:915 length:243 start_codon:yes stop_codon:yes gene_type:complete